MIAQKRALRSTIASKLSAIPPQAIQEQSINTFLHVNVIIHDNNTIPLISQQMPSSNVLVLFLSFVKQTP
ncbi:hypothetical protein Ac2012v2_006668 [Leucoagaricus gongylophorus]